MKPAKGSWFITAPIAAAAVGLVAFVILPGHRANAQLKKEIADKQEFLGAAEQRAALAAATQESLEKLQEFVQSADSNLARQGPSAVHAAITEAARDAGLITTRFDPRPPQPGEVVTRVPMNLACTGSFSQIARFLYLLESMPMTIWVESVELRRIAEAGEAVQFEASLVVFIVNSEKSG